MNSIFKICTWKAELRRAVSLLLIVALLTGIVPQSVYATQTGADSSSSIATYDGDGYKVTAQITACWGSYANVDFKITNKSLHKMEAWQLKIPKTFTWSNLWNAHCAGEEGSYYVIEGEDWNRDIGLFGQVSFGGTMFFSSGEISLPKTCTVTDLKARAESAESEEDENTEISGDEETEIVEPMETSKLPYEIPEELEGINYALFCGSTDGVSIYSNETKIYGDVHSNGGFTYGGTKLHVTGSLNATKNIQINTSSMSDAKVIGRENENAAQILMPDLCKLLDENLFTNADEIKETIEINGDTFSGDGILYAKNNIIYNVGSAVSTEDKSLLLCAKEGNIILNGSAFEINGVLYAPNGCVTINANEVTINGRIIAEKVCLNGTYFNICAGDHDFDRIRDWIAEEEEQEEEILQADLLASGSLKQNRRVVLDLESTSGTSLPHSVKTKWNFTKIGDETAQEEEFIRIEENSATNIHKELLFKEAGTYKVSIELQQGESSITVEKEIVIEKDRAPEAGFVFGQDFFARNEKGLAVIEVQDKSISHDGDEIGERVWQIVYDANRDGVFDEKPEIISDANETKVIYQTKKAGKYKLLLTVTEHFDDTIKNFVTEDDYLSDQTEEYTENQSVAEVLNEAPQVSFDIQKAQKADIVFTMTDASKENIAYVNEQLASLQRDMESQGIDVRTTSVSTSTLTAKDSFAWKEYDHYNYQEMYGDRRVVEKHITHDDSSIHIVGYTEVPYKDFLYIPDESNNTKILQFDLQRNNNNWHTTIGGGFLFNTEIDEEKDLIHGFCVLLCFDSVKIMELDRVPLSDFRDGQGDYGKCIASVKIDNVFEKKQFRVQVNEKYISVWCNNEIILSNFVLPECTSYGYGPILWNARHGCDQISYFDFTNVKMTTVEGENLYDVLNEYKWRDGAQRYVVHLSDTEIPELSNDVALAKTAKSIIERDIKMLVIGEEMMEDEVRKLINATEQGAYFSYDNPEESMSRIREYITSDMDSLSVQIGDYISTEDLLSYPITYNDRENDAIYKQEWNYKRVPLSSDDLNMGDMTEHTCAGAIEKIEETGAYTVRLRVQDNPFADIEESVSGNSISGNSAFGEETGMWSESFEYPKTLLVQNLPVAELTVDISKDTSNYKNCAIIPKTSAYDPDHVGEANNGIVSESLMYKEVNDDEWTQGKPLTTVPIGGTYLFRYQVQDIEKSYSYPKVVVVDTNDIREFKPYEDTTPPEVTLIASKEKISLGESVQISAYAKDENPISFFELHCCNTLYLTEQGSFTYTPQTVGEHTLKLVVQDSARNEITKKIKLTVVNTDINAPQIQVDDIAHHSGVLKITGTIDDDKALKQYVVSYRRTENTYLQAYSATEEIANSTIAEIDISNWADGEYEFRISAEDEAGNQSFYSTYYTLTKGTITLKLSQAQAVTGSEVSVHVSGDGSISENSIKAYADDKEIPLTNGKGTITSDTPKKVNVLAQGITQNGECVSVSQNCYFVEKTDITAPMVSFENPALTVSEPTDLIGTVTDDEQLLAYRLTYRMENWDEEVLLAEGSEEKTKEILGTLDTTLLMNGVYEVRLWAMDEGGNESTAVCVCTVEGDLKVGEMAIGFKDLTTTLPFGELNILRMYDSRNPAEGDFGYGWSLGLSGMSIQKTGELETGYEQKRSGSGLATVYRLEETQPHDVIISYGDGTSDRFRVELSPKSRRWLALEEVQVSFVCETNPNLRLELAEDNTALVDGDELVWLEGSSDRKDYIFTMEDGTKVYISEDAGVTKTTDAVGNTMTYSEKGFLYADGRGVTFERDRRGRILKISDDLGHTRSYAYDEEGNLSTYTDQAGNVVTYIYDKEHHLTQIIDPSGITVARYEYDDSGRLIATIDAEGNRVAYEHDINSRKEIVTDRRGYATVYEYDKNGNIISVTDPEGNTIRSTYDKNGNVLTETDALGNTKCYQYDENNNIMQVTDAAGNVSNVAYNSKNQVTSMKNMDGIQTLVDYNDKGLLTKTEDTDGNVTEYEYDTYGNINGISDELGKVANYKYDETGNLVSVLDGEGNETRHNYDKKGNRTSTVVTKLNAEGKKVTVTTNYTYDDAGRVIKAYNRQTGTITTTYDASGNISATSDGEGKTTTYTHTPNGEVESITYHDGTKEHFTYDEEGNVLTQTDRLGNTVRNTYDKAGNLKTSVDALGNTTTYVYDAAYRVTKVITPTGAVTSYEYDNLGRNTKITTDLGSVTYGYDAYGNVLSMTDTAGNVTTYEYDDLGRKTAVILPDGTTLKTTYDARGNITSQTDGEGSTTTYEYDNNNNLTSITDGEGVTTTYVYNGVGELLKVTDANGNTTSYEYDQQGNVTKEIRADGKNKRYGYRLSGDISYMADYDGTWTGYQYGKFGLSEMGVAKQTVRYTYDEKGQIEAVSDSTGTIRYTYDAYGRITGRETAAGEKIAYGYDYFGRLNAITTSQGTTRYNYDKYNRLTSVTDHAGNETEYTYDSVGNKASQINPDGSVTAYIYDVCNRLVKEETHDSKGQLLASYEYTFNGNGQKVETREAVRSSGHGMVATITTYAYDKANRLTGESKTVAREDGTSDASDVKYFYDNVGNRIKKVEDGVTTEYTYNEVNQLQSEETEGQETISYAYDINGNLLCRGTTTEYETYTYSKENQLESVTSTTGAGETKETYTYDGEGNRLSKTESKAVKSVNETTGEITTTWEETGRTYYVMDTSGGYAQVIAELDENKDVKVLYTRGDGIVSREEKSENGESRFRFYLSDGHGDVRQLTDETGAVTDSYRYNSYGELEEAEGNTENSYLYTGEYYDEGTGLYYLRARYMNPETGTFTSMDTYRGNSYDPASLHRYTYAQNNPQMYNDPSGHFAGLIGAGTTLACAQMIRTSCITNITGTLTGFVNGIINEMLGGEEDPGTAFIKGYIFGAGMMVGIAAAYAGATAIKTLFAISDAVDMLCLAKEVKECVKSIVLAIVYGVTGCHTQAAIYVSFAAIYFTDIMVTLGLSGIVRARGPKGSVGIGVESGSKTTELVPYYPVNDGAISGTKHTEFLMPGDTIDRFGKTTGTYFSPSGTPLDMRALPYDANLSQYRQYQVMKPFEVEASTIAPAFDKIGLGTQYRSSVSAEVLEKRGIIKLIGGYW